MINSTYHQLLLIIDEMTSDIENNNHFDMVALDMILKNLGLIFDSMDTAEHIRDIRVDLANLIATGWSKKLIPESIYNAKLDCINTSCHRCLATKEKVSHLEKCLSLLMTKHSLAVNGNIFNNFNISTIRSMIEMPKLIQNYLQSGELLNNIYAFVVHLHDILFTSGVNTAKQNAIESAKAALDLAEQAGYITTAQKDESMTLFYTATSIAGFGDQLASILNLHLDTQDTTYFFK